MIKKVISVALALLLTNAAAQIPTPCHGPMGDCQCRTWQCYSNS